MESEVKGEIVERQPWGKLIPSLPTLDQIVLKQPSIKIGRALSCDVVIDKNGILSKDTSISKEHCLLTKEPGDELIYITDLSKNGTFLNGIKIGRNNKMLLKDKDKIAMAKNNAEVYVFQSITKEELPDTLTSVSSSESPMIMTNVTLRAWGRLIACLLHLSSFDLYNSVFKVGRSSQCDAVVEAMHINPKIKTHFSKEQFAIYQCQDSSVVVITDLSSTGTYLNGKLIGRNNRNILQHDDTISIGKKRKRVYVFKSMTPSDSNYLPPTLRSRYQISTLLGKGACGEVKLAYEKRTCEMYAIKKIIKGRSSISQLCKLNHPNKIQTEIKILESLTPLSPFVIYMKEIEETQDEVFLVLEYMKGGELSDRILSNVVLTESNVKFMFYQMVQAVDFLHRNGITHRDLKPENVLLSSKDIETIVKVSDFGLSKITEEDDMMRTKCGTLNYIAPEILDSRISQYDKQVDVWSLGVILFYMLSKRLPFKSPDTKTLQQLILSGTYNMNDSSWNGISYHAKDLVTKMLIVNPEERITISTIVNHPWISKDTAMQYRVKLLVENQTSSDTSEDIDSSNEGTPPSKRVRLSSSDESN